MLGLGSVIRLLSRAEQTKNLLAVLERMSRGTDANTAEKAKEILSALKEMLPEITSPAPIQLPEATSTGAGLLGFKWSYFNNFCLISVAVVGGVWAFRFLWKQKPPLDPGLDPEMVQDARNVAEEVGLPSILFEKKLGLLKNEGELVNLTFDLNRDLLIKKIHVMDSSFAIAANSATSLISIERLALFSILAIVGLITYRFRKQLMNKVRYFLLDFLRDDE